MEMLLSYKENDEFVIERVNNGYGYPFEEDSFKRRYTTESDFEKGLRSYQLVIKEYDVIALKELESIVSKVYFEVYVSYR